MSFPNLGPTEWIIIGIILVVLFGSKKMSEIARGLGESNKELKRAKKEFQSAVSDQELEPEKPPEPEKKDKED